MHSTHTYMCTYICKSYWFYFSGEPQLTQGEGRRFQKAKTKCRQDMLMGSGVIGSEAVLTPERDKVGMEAWGQPLMRVISNR